MIPLPVQWTNLCETDREFNFLLVKIDKNIFNVSNDHRDTWIDDILRSNKIVAHQFQETKLPSHANIFYLRIK